MDDHIIKWSVTLISVNKFVVKENSLSSFLPQHSGNYPHGVIRESQSALTDDSEAILFAPFINWFISKNLQFANEIRLYNAVT